jgi:hypothetical protein
LAPTLVAIGWPERAARMLAAAAPICQTLAAPLPPAEPTAVAHATAAALT